MDSSLDTRGRQWSTEAQSLRSPFSWGPCPQETVGLGAAKMPTLGQRVPGPQLHPTVIHASGTGDPRLGLGPDVQWAGGKLGAVAWSPASCLHSLPPPQPALTWPWTSLGVPQEGQLVGHQVLNFGVPIVQAEATGMGVLSPESHCPPTCSPALWKSWPYAPGGSLQASSLVSSGPGLTGPTPGQPGLPADGAVQGPQPWRTEGTCWGTAYHGPPSA